MAEGAGGVSHPRKSVRAPEKIFEGAPNLNLTIHSKKIRTVEETLQNQNLSNGLAQIQFLN